MNSNYRGSNPTRKGQPFKETSNIRLQANHLPLFLKKLKKKLKNPKSKIN